MSLPSTPLPSTTNPFFQNLSNPEDNWDFDSQQSPGSKRCPTFKDYAEKIRQLQQENFQLRIRVFLSEQKSGVKTSTSDIQVLIQQNMQYLQNSTSANNNNNTEIESKLEEEILKVRRLETKLDEEVRKVRQSETKLDGEVMRVRQLEMQLNDEVMKVRQLEVKFDDEVMKVHQLEEQMSRVKRKGGKAKETIANLEANSIRLEEEKRNLEKKFMECSKVFVDLGRRNVALSEEIEKFKLAQQKRMDQSNALPVDSFMQERYDSIRETISMLQGRMKDVIAFVDAIFNLESKNIFFHIGLQDPSFRERLQTSVEQCRRLSSNLDNLFQHADKSMMTDKRIKDLENDSLMERLTISDNALKQLHREHAKLVAMLKSMQPIPAINQENLIKSFNESERRPSDATSPDLGIDSGHDGAANSDDSHSINYKQENGELRKTNRELAHKLRQTKQALDNTLEKLHSTSKQKEEVEKAICRQLHKTHTILRHARKSVEKFANQENIVPS